MKVRTEEEAIALTLKGEKEAFAFLVDRYMKPIYNLIYRMVGDPDEASELTQSVFVKAYESLPTFDPHKKFFSWLYRIAVNEALNHRRQRNRHEPLEHDPPSHRRSPDEDAAASELSERVNSMLLQLKFDYQVVLILKHFAGFSYNEISEILDLPVKTVKWRLFSGREQLRKMMIREGIMP